MRSTRRSIARNVFIVAILFILMSALILVAHLYQPKPIVPPDPPERMAMARDRALNGWWLCRDACRLLPRRFRAPLFTGSIEGQDYAFYEPAPGSLGELLHIGRPDDDGAIAQYVRRAAYSTEITQRAISKPIFTKYLYGPGYDELERDAPHLVRLLIAAAAQRSRAGDHVGACGLVRDALRLDRLQNSDNYAGYLESGEVIVPVLRQWPRRVQRQMLDFLLSFRRAWRPPREEIKRVLREIDSKATRPMGDSEGMAGHIVRRVRAVRKKRQAIQDKAALFEFAGLLHYQVPEFRARNRETFFELRTSYQLQMKTPATNSLHIGLIDGLAIATAIELYRRDNPAYPDSLDSLVPRYLAKLPVDPFSGKPFIYRRDNGDYVLACAGEDKVESSDDLTIAFPKHRRANYDGWREMARPIEAQPKSAAGSR
jgi:hypothetical protein